MPRRNTSWPAEGILWEGGECDWMGHAFCQKKFCEEDTTEKKKTNLGRLFRQAQRSCQKTLGRLKWGRVSLTPGEKKKKSEKGTLGGRHGE